MTKPRVRFAAAAVSGLALGGCTLLPSPSPPQADSVHLAGKAYEQALEAPRVNTQDIAAYRASLIEATLKQARQQQRESRLYQAEETILIGLKYLPEEPRLRSALEEIRTQRLAQLRRVENTAVIAEARYRLSRERVLQQEQRLTSTGLNHRWQLEQNRRKLNELAESLKTCAQYSLEHDMKTHAGECIELAARIRGDGFVRAQARQLARLDEAGMETPAAPPPAESARPAKPEPAGRPPRPSAEKMARLRAALIEAMNQGELVKARTLTAELREKYGDSPELQNLQTSVDAAIAAQISSLHEQANEHYRKQRYQLARETWQTILELDPGNSQARSLIKRAERVINKLEELQQNDSAETGQTPQPQPKSGQAE